MITLNDCLERSLTGPVMREKDFDLKVSARLRELYIGRHEHIPTLAAPGRNRRRLG